VTGAVIVSPVLATSVSLVFVPPPQAAASVRARGRWRMAVS
jgi:hypothetical protein